MNAKQGYFIEHNGDCWQSIFPAALAELSQLHVSVEDAREYMTVECKVVETITVL